MQSKNKSIPVLCYHKVSYNDGITPDRFEEHLEYLKNNGFTAISARQLVDFMENGADVPEKPVVLTFDDCFLDNWVYAMPMLEKYGWRGVFFCITDFTGKGDTRPQMGSENLPEIKPATESYIEAISGDKTQFLNEAELIEAHKKGHEIYSHTCTHMMTFRNIKSRGAYPKKFHWGMAWIYGGMHEGDVLYQKASAYAFDGVKPAGDSFRARTTKERYDFCLDEYKRSRKYLEDLLGVNDLDMFCHPWGDFDDVNTQALRDAGYKAAFTLERFSNCVGEDPMYINRIGVGFKTEVKWLKSKLSIYSNRFTARLFFKKFTKKGEINRILYITDSTKFSSGGIRQLMYNLRGLSEMGFRPVLVCKKDSEIAEMGAKYADVRYADFSSVFRAADDVKKVISEYKPNIIHTYHNKAHKAAVTAKIKSGTKAKLFVNRGVLAKPGNLLYYINPFVNGFTVNSKECAKVLASRFINKKKINLIHNGIDTSVFNPKAGTGKTRVVYIGNEAPVKGCDLFYKAISQVKDVEFQPVVIGLAEAWEKDGVISTGKLRDVQNELFEGDIFVLSSRSESFPNVLLEAMACGMAAVCFDVGAVSEIIEDGVNGYIAPQEDTSALASRIEYLLKNPEIRSTMGKKNRQDVTRRFSYHSKCVNLLKLYSGETFRSF
ncbi:MAG: glycosyltransferase [Deferribacterales bacterium]